MPTFLRFAFAALGAALVTLTLFLAMPALLQFDDPEPGEALQRWQIQRLAEIEPGPFIHSFGCWGEQGPFWSDYYRDIPNVSGATPVRVASSPPEPLPPGHVYAPPLATRESALEPIRIELI